MFGRLGRELQVRKVNQGPYFFASHPKVTERVENYHEFAAGAPPIAPEDPAPFLAATSAARMSALADIHTRANGPLLVFLLQEEGLLDSLPPEARFYLGEGYRLRNAEGDRDRAIAAWRETIVAAPAFGPAYGALGFAALRAGEKVEALDMLSRFVDLSPDSRQAAYARQSLARLRAELPVSPSPEVTAAEPDPQPLEGEDSETSGQAALVVAPPDEPPPAASPTQAEQPESSP